MSLMIRYSTVRDIGINLVYTKSVLQVHFTRKKRSTYTSYVPDSQPHAFILSESEPYI